MSVDRRPVTFASRALEIAVFRAGIEEIIEGLIELLDAIDAPDEDKEADADGEAEVDNCEAGDDAPIAGRGRYLPGDHEDDEEQYG